MKRESFPSVFTAWLQTELSGLICYNQTILMKQQQLLGVNETLCNNMCFLNVLGNSNEPNGLQPMITSKQWAPREKKKSLMKNTLLVTVATLPQIVGHECLLLSELGFSASSQPIFSPCGTPAIILISSEIHHPLSRLPKVGSCLHCMTKQGSLTLT